MSIIAIYTGGILTLLMVSFHIVFPKLFKWEKDFGRITELNKKVFYTIHLALLLIFIILGILSFVYALELSESNGLAFGLNLLISLFWFWRTVWQVIYFKGKTMHLVLIILFFLLSVSYMTPVIIKMGQ